MNPKLLAFVAALGAVTINKKQFTPERTLSYGRVRLVSPDGERVTLSSSQLNQAIGKHAGDWFTKDQAWRRGE